ESADRVGRQGVEVVVLSGMRMEMVAQGDARDIERIAHGQPETGPRAAEEGESVAGSVHALERRFRNVDGIVLVTAEGGPQLFLNADHHELRAFDANRFAERRDVAG